MDEYIDDFSVLIRRRQQVVLLPVDLDEDFVKEERISKSMMMAFQPSDVFRAKFVALKSDCLNADDNAALRQQVFAIPMTEVDAAAEPNGMLTDFGRKPMALVLILGRTHGQLSLPRRRFALVSRNTMNFTSNVYA